MKLTMLIKWDSSALQYASTTQKQDFNPPSDLWFINYSSNII